jgi:hypothetical protein
MFGRIITRFFSGGDTTSASPGAPSMPCGRTSPSPLHLARRGGGTLRTA